MDSSAAALELAVKCRLQRRRVDDAQGRCVRRAGGAGRRAGRFDVVIVDPPAFAKRKKDLPKAQAAYKRLNQLAMRCWPRTAFWCRAPARIISAPRSCRMPSPRRRAAPAGRCRSWKRRPVAGSSGASGHSRDALSEGVFLSRQRHFEISARMLTYPHIDPIAISIGPLFGVGPLRVHWYGIMYLVGFARGVVAGALARAHRRLDLDGPRHRRSDLLLRRRRDPRRPRRLVPVLRPRRNRGKLAQRVSHLGWRHVVPRRPGRRAGGGVLFARIKRKRIADVVTSSRRCRASASWRCASAISSTANCGASPPTCRGRFACRMPKVS